MKKLFKTSLAVAMSVCMAAAMTACGGSSSASSSAPADNGAATEESAPADNGAAADDAQSADTGAKIKIGGSGPLTGPAAVYGQAVKNAAEIAVEEVNAKGGIQFELNMQDDAHDPEKAVTAYGVLKDWGYAGFPCNCYFHSRRSGFPFLCRGQDLRDHPFRI